MNRMASIDAAGIPSISSNSVFMSSFTRAYRPALLIGLVLLGGSLLDTWHRAVSTPGTDFFIVWGVPHALSISAVPNIYSDEGQRALTSTLEADATSPDAS